MMRSYFVLLAIVVIGLAACKKENHGSFEGNYKGTFQRNTPTGSGFLAHITLSLTSDGFTGVSDSLRYPFICHGTWKLTDGSVVNFMNGCFWTTDFDGGQILTGDLHYERSGSHLKMWKAYSGYSYVYELDKAD